MAECLNKGVRKLSDKEALELELLKANIRKTLAEAAKAESEAAKAADESGKIKAETAKIKTETELLDYEAQRLVAEKFKLNNEGKKFNVEAFWTPAKITVSWLVGFGALLLLFYRLFFK